MAWTRSNVSVSYNTTGPQISQPGILGNTVIQYIQVGAGAVQLVLECSNDNASWETAESITLGSPGDHIFSVLVNSWRYFRINIISLTATSVQVEISGG